MGESESVLNVNDGDFSKEILESDIPVLVDFWATGCGPSLTIAPVVEALAREYAGKIKVAKIKIEENPQTPRQYGVRGIPTLILFKNGRAFDRVVGVVPKEKLRQLLEKGVRT
jgi:thioredoxin 1